MAGPLHQTARVVSVIAGTLVALSCGTNVRLLDCRWLSVVWFYSLMRMLTDILAVRILGMGSAVRPSHEALVNRKQPNRESAWLRTTMTPSLTDFRARREIWGCMLWASPWVY